MIAAAIMDTLTPMVESIAAEYGRRYHQYGASNEDFAQQLWLWVFENGHQLSTWLDPELFEPKVADKLIAQSMRNECKDYAVDVKAQSLGYERVDLHWYSKGEIKALLPSMFNPDAWHEPPQSEGRSTKAPSEGGNWIATLADLAQAYKRMTEYDQSILEALHKDGWTQAMLAESLRIPEQTMSYHHDRALGRMVRMLGDTKPNPMKEQANPRDPWRGRHSVSNAGARAYQQQVYDA